MLLLLALLLVLFIVSVWLVQSFQSASRCQVRQFRESLTNPKTVAIVTLETRRSDLCVAHNKNMQEYADRHGYTYIFMKEPVSELPIYWQKLEVILQVLDTGLYSWVLWMDSDAFFINLSIPLETLWQDHEKPVVMGRDTHCLTVLGIPVCYDLPWPLRLNAGVILVKACPRGRDVISKCLEDLLNSSWCRDAQGQPALNGFWAGPCYEQGRLNLRAFPWSQDVHIAASDLIFNSSLCPNKKQFISHVWCGNHEVRLSCFERLL
jgi:hypothetical protein